jgi:hypothetical protein
MTLRKSSRRWGRGLTSRTLEDVQTTKLPAVSRRTRFSQTSTRASLFNQATPPELKTSSALGRSFLSTSQFLAAVSDPYGSHVLAKGAYFGFCQIFGCSMT